MYDIQTEMKLTQQDDILAYGTVTVNSCIRFVVQMRKCRTSEGSENIFLTYPRQCRDGKWSNVIQINPKLQHEIETCVVIAVKKEILADIHLPEIEDIQVTCLDPKEEKQKISVCGIASVTISGITIKRILIKRSEKGFFINMPQFRQPDGHYRDLAYATRKSLQRKIEEAVLDTYQAMITERKE